MSGGASARRIRRARSVTFSSTRTSSDRGSDRSTRFALGLERRISGNTWLAVSFGGESGRIDGANQGFVLSYPELELEPQGLVEYLSAAHTRGNVRAIQFATVLAWLSAATPAWAQVQTARLESSPAANALSVAPIGVWPIFVFLLLAVLLGLNAWVTRL